jgi:D123
VDKGPIARKTVALLRDALENACPLSAAELAAASTETREHALTHAGLDPRRVLLALRQAFFSVLAVRTADEALALLAYSSRVVSDLKRALDHAHILEWSMQLVVRQFVPMQARGELRGFVCGDRLNALSQYYCDCYFPRLCAQRARYAEAVHAFFSSEQQKRGGKQEEHQQKQGEELHQQNQEVSGGVCAALSHLGAYVVDFVVFERDTPTPHLEVKIVELNPFSESTGACLFDWQRDATLLREGPFCMRVVESPPLDNRPECYLPWKALVDEALQPAQENEEGTVQRESEEARREKTTDAQSGCVLC